MNTIAPAHDHGSRDDLVATAVCLATSGVIAASFALALSVATPPNAIVLGSGYLKQKQTMRAGVVLDLVTTALFTVFVCCSGSSGRRSSGGRFDRLGLCVGSRRVIFARPELAAMETSRGRLRALVSGYGLGVGGAVLALVLTGVSLLAGSIIGFGGTTAERFALVFLFGQYVPFLGVPLAYFRSRGMSFDAVREYLGIRAPSLREVGIVLAGLLGILVLATAMSLAVRALGAQPASNSAATQARETPQIIPFLIVAMLIAVGPCEETLFRGTVQNRLRESFSAVAAIPLTAVLFAAIHFTALAPDSGSRLVTIGVLFVPSLVFGVIYEYTDNLVVPVATHGLWNSLLLVSIYVAT